MLFYVTCQKHVKITYFCFLPVFLPRVSDEIVVMFCFGVQDQEREEPPLSSVLSWLLVWWAAQRTASTHGSAVEHNVAPKSLKGFGHLSVMLKGKKIPQTLKKNPKPLPCHNSVYLQDLCFTNIQKRLVKWHYSIPKMTQDKQLSEVLLMLKNFSQISMARDQVVTPLED